MEEKLRYTVRKRDKLFWQPTKEMRALGFRSKPLGKDGEEARAEARRLAATWDKAKTEREKVTGYPDGSFGAYYDRLKGSSAAPSQWWTKKGVRTREDYERAWEHIDAWTPPKADITLSHHLVTKISTETVEAFYAHLERSVSPRARWRTIKSLKVLLGDAVVRLRLGYDSPAANVVNAQPAGRASIWLGAEVDILAAKAKAMGFDGISLAIRLAWETMFSPVDVRTLRPHQIKRDGEGHYVEGTRAKTGRDTFAALSPGLAQDTIDYIVAQNRSIADETPIIRQRDGKPYQNKDTFSADFRDVRKAAFPGDTRQLMDIRRSANVEADAAGADKKTMGELLANGLADSKFLDETYTPPTVAKAREVAAQRIQGRAKLAGEVLRSRNKP